MNELEDRSIEITKRENVGWGVRKQTRVSKTCG